MSVHKTTIVHYRFEGEQFKYVNYPHGNRLPAYYRYMVGDIPPRYPMPSLYCFSLISNKVDERACEMNITDMLFSMLD